MLRLLSSAVLCLLSVSTFACGKTELIYKILRSCEIEIEQMTCLSGTLGNDKEAEKARWLLYLQRPASTEADKQRGVPANTRKLIRGGDEDSLYCEISEGGLVLKAYTLPSRWSESQRRWIPEPRKEVALVDGQLRKEELHRSVVITVH